MAGNDASTANLEYDLFLCHNKADKSWVHELAQRIETEQYQDRTLRVFFDQWDVKPGENLVLRLEAGLKKSRFVGVVLSPEMLQAEWPTLEWTMAVYSDPSGRKGFVIPILRRNCEIPLSLRIRNGLDFRRDEDFDKEYSRLIALLKGEQLLRGKKAPVVQSWRGIPEQVLLTFDHADNVSEQLASNLFPLMKYPKLIWSAPTWAKTPAEVYDHLSRLLIGVLPTFVLRENRIFCFWDLNEPECPFNELISSDGIGSVGINSWHGDKDKWNWFMELLNRALKNYCSHLNLRFDKEHNRFYFTPDHGKDRIVEWTPTVGKPRKRTVAKRYVKGVNGEFFWAHQAARLRFISLGDDVYLKIETGWTFTQDGRTPLPSDRMSSISTKWMHDEYNPSLLTHIRFWAYYLSVGLDRIKIPTGSTMLDISSVPVTTKINAGIYGDQLTIEKMYEVVEKEIPPPDIFINDEDKFEPDRVDDEV